jgi:hypothetical protein
MNEMWVYIQSEPRLWTVGFYDPKDMRGDLCVDCHTERSDAFHFSDEAPFLPEDE